jgi:dynein light intermediate chain
MADGGSRIAYLEADGPIDEDQTLIRYAVPFAPLDEKKTAKFRKKLGLSPDVPMEDPNVRAVLDSFIQPRAWIDQAGTRWEQHASSDASARIDVVRTREKLRQLCAQQSARPTGVCPVRTYLYAECFIELIRQTVCESWERGLLLLKVHAERVLAQKAHRELFESRTGYAFRLALKGEKDTAAMVDRIAYLNQRKKELAEQEAHYHKLCDEFGASSEETLKIDEKKYNDELNLLKKEAAQKKALLESLIAPVKKN